MDGIDGMATIPYATSPDMSGCLISIPSIPSIPDGSGSTRGPCVPVGDPPSGGTLGSVAAWVYLLRCRDGSLYCGWTVDVAKRVDQHNAGRGAAYTRSRKPVALVWHEPCADRSAALRRELAIKRLTRRQKLALVARGTLQAPASPSALPGG